MNIGPVMTHRDDVNNELNTWRCRWLALNGKLCDENCCHDMLHDHRTRLYVSTNG